MLNNKREPQPIRTQPEALTIALIQAGPKQYTLKSTFKLPQRQGMDGPGWSHPVIVDGSLYLRHADVLLVYDLKAL